MEEIILNTGMKGPGYQSQTEEIQKTALGMGLTSLNDNAGHGDLIEMCTGYDMITGEDLTDFERGLRGVFAVVDVVTLFIGIKASGVAKLFSREALETGGRIIATDMISNGTAYAVGKMGEELGLPLPITLMLSMGAGVTVSLTAGKYVFKDSAGNVVLEAGADEVDGIRTQIKQGVETGSDVLEGGLDASIKNIDEFIGGNKSFDDVLDDYAKVYADKINSNQAWSWDDTIPGGEDLTKKQRSIIKQQAIDDGLIPDIKVTKVEGMRYGFADFESAGVVKETQYLPENMWTVSDAEQFKWLDEQIGGTVEGYTWHHTETPGKMQLVPTGIHNITTHNGGRTAGMWADAPR